MSFIDKLFSTGKKKGPQSCEPLIVYAPANGEMLALEKFPDPVFSEGIIGPGCGIIPSDGQIKSPFNGTVIQLPDTLHAVGLKSDSGIELLIHIGVDTVDMAGKGFTSTIKNGQEVRVGETLILFDREVICSAGHADTIAVIVTNADEFTGLKILAEGKLTAGDVLLEIQEKA